MDVVEKIDFKYVVSILVGIFFGGLTFILPSIPLAPFFQALIIGQASLLAIVISVSLLSIQISSTQYTPLVTRILQEDKFLTPEIAIYLSSIVLDILFLFITPNISPILLFIPITIAISFAVFNFLLLFKIKQEMFDLVNPEPILDKTVKTIDFESYKKYSQEKGNNSNTSRSPLLEILQIIQISLKQGDNYTALYAIDSLAETTHKLTEEYGKIPIDKRNDIDFDYKLFEKYWKRVNKSAVEHGIDDILRVTAKHEKEIAILATKYNCKNIGSHFSDALASLGEEIIKNDRLEDNHYHRGLTEILKKAIDNDSPFIADSVAFDMNLFMIRVFTKYKKLDEIDENEIDLIEHIVSGHFTAGYRDAMKQLIDEKDNELREKSEYQDLFYKLEEYYSRFLGFYLGDTYPGSTDRIRRDLRSVGVDAAENDNQVIVSHISQILIEFYIFSDEVSDKFFDSLDYIVDKGGREGVKDAFDSLLGFSNFGILYKSSNIPLRKSIEKKGYKDEIFRSPHLESKTEEQKEVFRECFSFNSIEDYRKQVNKVRQKMKSTL